jgi:NADPH:quinone reductase-like Zn-dependent oxidoreductase
MPDRNIHLTADLHHAPGTGRLPRLSAWTRHFIRHYVEMVAAMFLGMAVLGVPAGWRLDAVGSSWSELNTDAPALMLLGMAVTMTVPMVGWMRYRGHGWRANAEMSASMLVPTAAAIGVVQAGLLGIDVLLVAEHVVMLFAMLGVMLLRPAEYAPPRRRPWEPPSMTAGPESMMAVVQDAYGPAPEDVLRVEAIGKPAIGEDEVLVRVHAASVDRGTWHVMAGLPYPIRLAGFGLRRPKYGNPGRSLAGTVEAVGAGVTGVKPGEAVFGIGDASFAQYARARPEKLAPKPANLSFDHAAAVPVSALTALQGVRDRGQVQAGQQVLIVGASGGVGTFAVQIAKAFGAEVTGVCSTAKVDAVRALGADHVVDYTTDDFADGERRYDVILDIGGNRRLAHLRGALTPKGRLVIVGGETDGRWLGGVDRQLRALVLSPLVAQKLTTFVASENAADLIFLRQLIESGQVAPAIDRTYPLTEVAAAIRHMLDGHARGKIVVSV